MKDSKYTQEKVQRLIRKKYSEQFKEQALVLAKKHGVTQAAKDLGLSTAILYNWRAKQGQSGEPLENQKLHLAEIAALKRQTEQLLMENAFLKKAAAYFAKEQK
jgi:transposase